jgi:hypothetical protein
MRAGSRRLAWIGLLVWLCAAICGCYSSDYSRQTAATASMLGDLALKLSDYCRAGFKLGDREVTSEEMGEFYYALKKARSYTSGASANSNLQSYRDLSQLVEDYGKLLNQADRYRLAGKPDQQQLAEIVAAQQRTTNEANAVLKDLQKQASG